MRGAGTTVNFPLPAGATGDVYLDSIDSVVAPARRGVRARRGSWCRRATTPTGRIPLTGLGLAAGDYADLTARVMALAAPRRLVVFLEGGYDLEALRDSTAATVSTLIGAPERIEPATSGGPGRTVVHAARDLHAAGPGLPEPDRRRIDRISGPDPLQRRPGPADRQRVGPRARSSRECR